MRRLLIALLPLATITAAWAAGGVYATLSARDAAACARLCADDGLCMAWSFRAENSCDLRATVPEATGTEGASGLSSRAPGAMRSWTQISTQTEPPAPAPMAAPATENASPPTDLPQDDVSAMLLGGPEGDAPLE